jgi:hypothetical protein
LVRNERTPGHRDNHRDRANRPNPLTCHHPADLLQTLILT